MDLLYTRGSACSLGREFVHTPAPAVRESVRQGERMKRIAVLIAIVAVAVLLAKRLGLRFDLASRIAAMPDTAPPKWIFSNVTAIRANTDQILDLLQRQATAEPEHPAPAVPEG